MLMASYLCLQKKEISGEAKILLESISMCTSKLRYYRKFSITMIEGKDGKDINPCTQALSKFGEHPADFISLYSAKSL